MCLMTLAGSDFRKKAEAMLSKSGTEFTEMSADVLQQFMYEFQVHQIELELQNEELKHSQSELMTSRDRYAQLYNSLPIAYLSLNESGAIQDLNPAAVQLLESHRDNLLNKKLGLFINSLDQDSFYCFIQEILNQHTDSILITRLNIPSRKLNDFDKNGLKVCGCLPKDCPYNTEFIIVECRGTCSDKQAKQVNLSMIDVTATISAHDAIACINQKMEQKIFQQNSALTRANQDLLSKIEKLNFYKLELIEREEKLNSIFNAAVEGIITMDMDGCIVSINNAVESIFGYCKAELINHSITKIIPLSPYLRNKSEHWLAGANGNVREVTGVHKNGTTLPLDVSIAQFCIAGTSYLTSIVRDVTARKMQEQRDQRHLDELAHVTRMGLLGEMASGIAHEVNQPLTAIASYSQVCLNLVQAEKIDHAQLSEILLKSKQQALKAGQIIHRMRDFVKFNISHRSTVDMGELITDAVGLCESYIKQHSICVNLQLESQLPMLAIDRIQIEQVILNLIKNSIDALIRLPKSVPRILSIQTAMSGANALEVRIKDNGHGIEVADQVKIFTPFFTTKSDGMGMGLSICRSIIESHQGVLRFNSQRDKGTTFYFTLPTRDIS